MSRRVVWKQLQPLSHAAPLETGLGTPHSFFMQPSPGCVALKRFSMARNERGFLSAANRVNGGRYDQAVLAGLA
jgi:hypothetical protein